MSDARKGLIEALTVAKETVDGWVKESTGRVSVHTDVISKAIDAAIYDANRLQAYLTEDAVAIRAKNEELSAERALCDQIKESLNYIYPTIAGRVIVLKQSGELVAVKEWNELCIRIIEALAAYRASRETKVTK